MHLFCLKIIGRSSNQQTYLWTKFPVETHLFDSSGVPMSKVDNSLIRKYLSKEVIRIQILLGFSPESHVLSIGKNSLNVLNNDTY